MPNTTLRATPVNVPANGAVKISEEAIVRSMFAVQNTGAGDLALSLDGVTRHWEMAPAASPVRQGGGYSFENAAMPTNAFWLMSTAGTTANVLQGG